MRAYEIILNGKRLCVAGIDGDGVLTAILTHVGKEEYFDVGGLVSATHEHLIWADRRLKVGDEVRLRVLESVSSDPPKKVRRSDPAQELKGKKNYVRWMAKELGWTLDESSGRVRRRAAQA
jgi:hypothetical protein